MSIVMALAGQASVHAQPAAPTPAPNQVRLPALGESASDDFNLSAEKRLGEQIMRDIRRDPDFIDDPLLLEYLQSVWQPILQAARERGEIGADVALLFPFEAFLVRDRSVNAFALPGGYVGVHLGLIAMTATRDELASVLAHEFSHISRRHIARSISSSSRNSSLALAAMILGLLAASRSSNPDAAQAAIVGGQAAMAQSQLNFSRDMEREADRNGQSLMAQAGFSPSGMAAMFNKLDQGNRLNDSGTFPYLRSHPLTTERIAEAQQRAAQAGSGAPVPVDLTRWHSLMQARAKVLMDPSVDSMRRLQELDSHAGTPQERLAGLYASALASIRLRDFARADRALAAAGSLPGVRDDQFVQRAFAPLFIQLALARGDVRSASMAAATLDASATSRPAMLLRAQVALAAGDEAAVRQSTEALQTWVSEHRLDATAWQALSHCAEQQGQPLRAVRAAAEAQAAIGNIQGAMDRLRAGQQLARRGAVGNDFIEASVIDSRLRDLQVQRRELMAEQRGSGRRGGDDDNRPDGNQ
jgi:predicted Zn-dependent protease